MTFPTNLATPAVKTAGNALAGMYARLQEPDGGFTYQPLTDDEPKEGFAVSIYPKRSVAIDVKNLKPKDMVKYAKKNADLFKKSDHYLGAWHDPASGKVFLDVSIVSRNRRAVRQLALAHDQIAYFDIGKGKSITVNRLATSGGASKK